MDIVRVVMVQSATKTTIAPTAVKNCSNLLLLMIFYKLKPEIRALFTNLNLRSQIHELWPILQIIDTLRLTKLPLF